MDLYDELPQVVRVFAGNDLDYAICGGIAVAFHGYERFTRGIDLLILPEDLDRAHDLLEQVGFLDPSGRIPFKDRSGNNCPVFRGVSFQLAIMRVRKLEAYATYFSNDPKHHDLYRITKCDGPGFLILDLLVVNEALAEAWKNRMAYNWNGTEIKVVSKEGLAEMKRMAGRDKDLVDLKQLGLDDESANNEAK